MKSLKGSKTHDNLKAAFAGESQANRRYLYFAAKADVEGHNDVSALFRSTAEGETGHAHGHLEYMEAVGDPATNLPIGRTRENLKAAVAGETHEYTDMYPGHGEAGARRRLRRDRRLVRDPGEGGTQPRQPLPEGPRPTLGLDSFRSMREGSLEAPTRHPLAWKNPEFWDQAKAEKELERIFDICHGCRRCVSLCTTFPTLFDLVDSSETLEVDGVKKEDYWKVVDQCYLCDLCYMTKCPYVPPHPWNVDFPHVMLRAKAIKFKKGHQVPRSPALLHRRDRQARRDPGGCADASTRSIRIRFRAARCRRCSGCTRIASCRRMPRASSDRPRKRAKTFPVRDGAKTPGKVADLLHLLRELQRARDGARPARHPRAQRDPLRDRREGSLLRHAQARARRPGWRGCAQSQESSGAGEVRARRLRDPRRRCLPAR